MAILFALLLAGAASAVPVKPWERDQEVDCSWWLSGPNGREHHASIGRGDEHPVLSISDRAFLPFTEEMDVPVTLRFDRDPSRTASAVGWSSSIVGDGERMLGVYLGPDARRAMGGATRIEVFHQGKLLTEIPLAATPSHAELDACVSIPHDHSDEE